MHHFKKRLLMTLLAALHCGCMNSMMERQSKLRTQQVPECPLAYALTRLEISGLEWAFSDSLSPPDACLAAFYPKAGKDSHSLSMIRLASPLMMLSLPVDAVLDTVTLPLSVKGASRTDE